MKRAIAALALALVALAAPRPAHARGCHGGGHGGHAGGHSHGHSSSHPSCHELSDVVGRERCHRFGAWSPPSWLRVSVSAGWSRLTTTQGAGLTHDAGAARAITSPAASSEAYDMGEVRVALGIGRHLEIGSLVQDAPANGAGDTFAFGGGLVAAAHVAVAGVMIRSELLVGARVVALSTACDVPAGMKTGSLRGIVSPRLSVERPLSPWLAAGVTVGTNLVHREERSFGVYLLFRTPSLAF